MNDRAQFVLTSLKLHDEGLQLCFVFVIGDPLPNFLTSVSWRLKYELAWLLRGSFIFRDTDESVQITDLTAAPERSVLALLISAGTAWLPTSLGCKPGAGRVAACPAAPSDSGAPRGSTSGKPERRGTTSLLIILFILPYFPTVDCTDLST